MFTLFSFLAVADSCYLNDACAGICNNVHDAGYYCSCEAGFELAADGVSCIGEFQLLPVAVW